KQILFARGKHLGQAGDETLLYVINVEGSGERLLRRESPDSTHGFLTSPAWSPDGKRIAFTRIDYTKAPDYGVYVMNADGTGATKILDDAGEPAWSPDGKSIAFLSYRDRLGETCFHDCNPSA